MTLRRARARIAAAYPSLSVTFWGLSGAAFEKARAGGDGILRADLSDAPTRHKLASWALPEAIDLTPFDHVFLVGPRYRLIAVQKLVRALQPWEWGHRARAQHVSHALLSAAIGAEVARALDDCAARLPLDHRYVLMPAPCPAEHALSTGPLHEPLTEAIASGGNAARSFSLHQNLLAEAHHARGLRFAAQPPETLSRPWLTRDEFLIDRDADARHMNDDYGLLAFRALAAAADL